MYSCIKKISWAALFVFSSLALHAASALIVETTGDSFIKKSGQTDLLSAQVGMDLGSQDEISTGKTGYIFLTFDTGAEVEIFENSRVAISKLADTDVAMKLDLGKLNNKVKKLAKGSNYTIQTPASVCAVRGTQFTVEVDESGKTRISVFAGAVATREISGIGEEMLVRENQMCEVIPGMAPRDLTAIDSAVPAMKALAMAQDTRAELIDEVKLDMTKEEVQAAAARELKVAEYELGKTMVDYFGKRVRIEEYIVRPRADQTKLVVLNERDDRFDYFTWKNTFNKDLPADLKSANQTAFEKDQNEVWTSEPDYWIKSKESAASNTVDSVEWTITVNGSTIDALANVSIPSITSTFVEAGVEYEADITGWGTYQEKQYFIDNEGKALSDAKWDALYNSQTDKFVRTELSELNIEWIYASDQFQGPEGKIDVVVSPEILADAGIISAE